MCILKYGDLPVRLLQSPLKVSYLYVKKDQTATNPKTAAALKARYMEAPRMEALAFWNIERKPRGLKSLVQTVKKADETRNHFHFLQDFLGTFILTDTFDALRPHHSLESLRVPTCKPSHWWTRFSIGFRSFCMGLEDAYAERQMTMGFLDFRSFLQTQMLMYAACCTFYILKKGAPMASGACGMLHKDVFCAGLRSTKCSTTSDIEHFQHGALIPLVNNIDM